MLLMSVPRVAKDTLYISRLFQRSIRYLSRHYRRGIYTVSKVRTCETAVNRHAAWFGARTVRDGSMRWPPWVADLDLAPAPFTNTPGLDSLHSLHGSPQSHPHAPHAHPVPTIDPMKQMANRLAMGFRPITSLHCLLREQLDARLTCPRCGHEEVLSAVWLRREAMTRYIWPDIAVVESRCRCSRCSHRGAVLTPTDRR